MAVVAVLYGSFRALGGGEPVPAEDYRALLGRLLEYTTTRAAEIASAIDEPRPARTPQEGESGRAAVDPMIEIAGAARKKLGGYMQQLNRIESDAAGEDADRLQGARTLLSAGIEDLAWACRLMEGGTYRDNTGLQRAVAELREHAGRCSEAVARLVQPQAPDDAAAATPSPRL